MSRMRKTQRPERSTSMEVGDGGKLAVSIRGKGKPLIWGHGLQCSMRADETWGILDWSRIEHSARVIRYDARAHGASSGSADPDVCQWENLAVDMRRVAERFARGDFVLGGASMGCATALWAAVQNPHRVAGLVLVIPPTGWELRARQARSYRLMSGVIRVAGKLPFRLLRRVLPERPGRNPISAVAREVLYEISERDTTDVVTAFEGAARSDLPTLEQCAALKVPALILAWPGDPVHPVSVARKLAEAMPHATLHVVEHEGDVRHWSALIGEFVASLRD